MAVDGHELEAERLAARAGAARGRDLRVVVAVPSPPWLAVGSAVFGVRHRERDRRRRPRPRARSTAATRACREAGGQRSARRVPDCVAPLQLCRSTRTGRVSPTPIESTGLTSPPSCGTPASRAQLSNCATCGSRCTCPCTAGTTRTDGVGRGRVPWSAVSVAPSLRGPAAVARRGVTVNVAVTGVPVGHAAEVAVAGGRPAGRKRSATAACSSDSLAGAARGPSRGTARRRRRRSGRSSGTSSVPSGRPPGAGIEAPWKIAVGSRAAGVEGHRGSRSA